jgi:predicted house-cleaning NTP pyrophosphatase (Maf/HAM1 superfamily)
MLIADVNGSYTNVMGLPLEALRRMLPCSEAVPEIQ